MSRSVRPVDRRPTTWRLLVRRLMVRLAAVAAGLVLAIAPHAPVSAHSELGFTVPADGAAAVGPVREVTVAFTDPVTLVGTGFEVLDSQGVVVVPFVVTDDDTRFRLLLEPPLAGGEVAVRYAVRAKDGHTIAGGFSFTAGPEPLPAGSAGATEEVMGPAPTTASGTSPTVGEQASVADHSSTAAHAVNVDDTRAVAPETVSGHALASEHGMVAAHEPAVRAEPVSAAIGAERGRGVGAVPADGDGQGVPALPAVGIAAVVAAIGARFRWLTRPVRSR